MRLKLNYMFGLSKRASMAFADHLCALGICTMLSHLQFAPIVHAEGL